MTYENQKIEKPSAASPDAVSSGGDFRRHGSIELPFAMLLAVLLMACHPEGGRSRAGEPAALGDLLTAAGESRIFQARLTGNSHQPCHEGPGEEWNSCIANARERERRLREFRYRILEQDSSQSPERLHLEALFLLVSSPEIRIDQAISLLERAAEEDPENALIHSDLAVALAYKARLHAQPQALFRALEAVGEALRIAPETSSALFNQALWLGQVGLREDAARVWERFIVVEAERDWREEGARRLKELRASELSPRWAVLANEMRSTKITQEDLARKLEGLHQQARELGEEELLTSWAREGSAHDLDLALKIGVVLQGSGEKLLLQAASLARELEASGEHEPLKEAHLAYADGLEAYERGEYGEARERFMSARDGFFVLGSPMAFWSELYLEIIAYFDLDFLGVEERLGLLEESEALVGSPVLRARCRWMRGLSRCKMGDLVACARHWEVGLDLYRELGEGENEAAVHALLAEVLRLLGDDERAWVHRLAALQKLPSVMAPRRLHNIYYEIAVTLLLGEQPKTALPYQDAMVRLADRVEDPFFGIEARHWRSRTLRDLDRMEEAWADLQQVEQMAESLDVAIRDRTLADVALATGTLRLGEDAGAALGDLDRALDLYLQGSDSGRLAELYLTRSQGRREIGADEEAMGDLEEGIRIFEESRELVPEKNLQVSYFDRSRDLFDHMIRVRLDAGESERAWEYLERARVRVLRDVSDTKEVSLPGVTEVQALIPRDTALVEYAVLDDETVVWILRGDSFESLRLRLPKADLDRLTEDLPRWMDPEQPTSEDLVLERLADLYQRLWAPLAGRLDEVERVVIIPDRGLHRVPFSALFSEDGFLLESLTISVAPSAALWARAMSTGRESVAPVSVMALGVEESPAALGLESLPAASREAEAVAALYPSATLLLHDEAHEQRLFAELAGHEVLHLSSHAIVNTRHPYLSFLALGADESGDGALYAHELYQRSFENLRLVVLASCRSAGGTISETEGPVSFARPFLAGGVRDVVATLWNIEDRASAEMLESFHRALRAGSLPAEALRVAQLEQLRENRLAVWKWGAFVVLGAG